MSFVTDLVKVPYLMRPNMQRIDKQDVVLTPEPSPHYKKIAVDAVGRNVEVWSELISRMPVQARDSYFSSPRLRDPNENHSLPRLHDLHCRFEDDIVVMNKDGVIELAYVSYPSGWAPEEHGGASFAEIHKRLPEAEHIQKASDHLVKMVMGRDCWRRKVWTLSPTSARSRHPSLRKVQETWDSTDRVYLRWEEQTFLPLHVGQRVIFLIHVKVETLESCCKTYADTVHVAAALESMTPAVRAYKGLDHPRVDELVRELMDYRFQQGS